MEQKLKKTFLILSFFLLTHLSGNTYSISGVVQDRATSKPLIGANVFVEGTSIGAAANDKGKYSITGRKEGSYIIKASYIGYNTFSDSLLVSGDDKKLTLNFSRHPFRIK